ncbi:hypothetical protein LTR10_014677 [Elasticomyces elasticus]|uniref:RGS domain-containing protein n=1 Tax=Exophiala sideris TaxID=1016849 RepID=A0ABR0J7B5_9EURO|nr:hypothetical protein LTR10_014677 [Elasticomyces elasticus]KAK5029322.1 hypothetical protein LTS07_005784 [Exophiala sideris]KAK5036984.1 hypothetical protein LTR13_005364 [Exophiala sideris]KAK5057952.1 hypothetical protein LTR69_006949 [Exophiala sideris]KAK5181911.1 hypothetical protein LTR44_005512 [Eurotiomycetes sp. CCFEE 6388]
MVLSLNYRRPAYVTTSSRTSFESEKPTESINSNSSSTHGIPDALSFDKIISGGTCPPVTTREFMDFLRYIEHDAENLQFFLWYRDYCQRFAELPESKQKLAPEWTPEQALAERTATEKEKPKKTNANAAAILKGTDFDPNLKLAVPDPYAPNPFNTPPRTPSATDHDSVAPSTVGYSEDGTTLRTGTTDHSKAAETAFEEAGTLQPFTIQPFREEISRIIAIYIAEGGARTLNLSAKEKAVLLKALSITTHPSAFRDVIATVEWSLRRQAHPNFIRWTICNGNPPRQTFAQGLGIAGIVAGIVYDIVITLSSANRGWRALGFLGLFIGIATLFAGWKGMCVVLHGMHHRHLRPWELFNDDDEASSDYALSKGSFDSLGSFNSYEDAPWVVKYEKRNVIRKIFDREVWIKEPALRQIQDTIFLQACITAFIISAVITAIFLAVPRGNFY